MKKIIFKTLSISALFAVLIINYQNRNNSTELIDISLKNLSLIKVEATEGPYGVINCNEASGYCPTCNGVLLNHFGSRYDNC